MGFALRRIGKARFLECRLALFGLFALSMKLVVLTASKSDQIFRRVVGRIAVHVVDMFIRPKKTAVCLLPNHPVLQDVASRIGHWVVGAKNAPVSALVLQSAAAPVRRIAPALAACVVSVDVPKRVAGVHAAPRESLCGNCSPLSTSALTKAITGKNIRRDVKTFTGLHCLECASSTEVPLYVLRRPLRMVRLPLKRLAAATCTQFWFHARQYSARASALQQSPGLCV